MLNKLSLGCLSLLLMGVIGPRQGAGMSPPGNLAILKPPTPSNSLALKRSPSRGSPQPPSLIPTLDNCLPRFLLSRCRPKGRRPGRPVPRAIRDQRR